MTHTAECQADLRRRRLAVIAWLARWPNHCTECFGRGCWSDLGSWDSPADGGPCGGCSEVGICARCGDPGLTAESRGDESTGEGPCTACGWDYDDCCPELPDGPCPCEIADWAEATQDGGDR